MNTLRRAFNPLTLLLFAAAVLVGATSAWSQTDLERTLEQFNSVNVQGYIQPVADLFGADMHTGYHHGADIERMGFHFRLDIIGMGAMVQDAQKTYTVLTPAGFNPGSFQAPTVFGGDKVIVQNATNALQTYSSPASGIINTSYFPLAVPQVTIGNIYGTQAQIRFVALPKTGNDKIPSIQLWGIGARHSISQYIPAFPVDLAAGVYYNSFNFGDLITFKGVALNAQASKSWSVLTLYGGLQWEKSSMDLSYTSTDVTAGNVSITLDGANNFRFIGGLALDLGPIHLFGDANLGSVTTLSAGIGFGN